MVKGICVTGSGPIRGVTVTEEQGGGARAVFNFIVSDGDDARRIGTRMDTASKGGGNQGHEFGTALSATEKEALVEYLKTL